MSRVYTACTLLTMPSCSRLVYPLLAAPAAAADPPSACDPASRAPGTRETKRSTVALGETGVGQCGWMEFGSQQCQIHHCAVCTCDCRCPNFNCSSDSLELLEMLCLTSPSLRMPSNEAKRASTLFIQHVVLQILRKIHNGAKP